MLFFFQAEDGIRDHCVTGVQTCALPILELADRTVMLLGGSGLVGHAMARRVLAATPPPRRLVLVRSEERRVGKEGRSSSGPEALETEMEDVIPASPMPTGMLQQRSTAHW